MITPRPSHRARSIRPLVPVPPLVFASECRTPPRTRGNGATKQRRRASLVEVSRVQVMSAWPPMRVHARVPPSWSRGATGQQRNEAAAVLRPWPGSAAASRLQTVTIPWSARMSGMSVEAAVRRLGRSRCLAGQLLQQPLRARHIRSPHSGQRGSMRPRRMWSQARQCVSSAARSSDVGPGGHRRLSQR